MRHPPVVRWGKRYRQRDIAAKDMATGRWRTYTSLAAFNKQCPTRGSGGLVCTLRGMRRLRDGSGLATVTTGRGILDGFTIDKQWRLHFGSHRMLFEFLGKRVSDPGGLASGPSEYLKEPHWFGCLRRVTREGKPVITFGKLYEWDPVSRTEGHERYGQAVQEGREPCVRATWELPADLSPQGRFRLDPRGRCLCWIADEKGLTPAKERIERELAQRYKEASRQRALLGRSR